MSQEQHTSNDAQDELNQGPINDAGIPGSLNSEDSVSAAAIYARTSASKRGHHYSIDEQVSRCWRRCDRQGWEVSFVFTDEGETGTDTERSGFQSMLRMAEHGQFDVVVFWKLDRFCRSLADLVKTEEKLDNWDVSLQSVTEYIDTTSPVGKFNYRNLASAAELESDLTSQRVRMGMHGLAKQLKWPNKEPPLGYDLTEERKLTPNEDEADLVRRIFRMYLDERSMPHVAHLLNEEGISTKTGGEWSRWAVKQILSNELYRGQYNVADYEEHEEEYRILSDELYEEVTDVRHRFKHQQEEVPEPRKKASAEPILDEFKRGRTE